MVISDMRGATEVAVLADGAEEVLVEGACMQRTLDRHSPPGSPPHVSYSSLCMEGVAATVACAALLLCSKRSWP